MSVFVQKCWLAPPICPSLCFLRLFSIFTGFSPFSSLQLNLQGWKVTGLPGAFGCKMWVALCLSLLYVSCLFIYFFKKDFIYLFMRDRERQRQREKQAPRREPNVGRDPRTLGSCPELKADAQLLSQQWDPGVPSCLFNAFLAPHVSSGSQKPRDRGKGMLTPGGGRQRPAQPNSSLQAQSRGLLSGGHGCLVKSLLCPG